MIFMKFAEIAPVAKDIVKILNLYPVSKYTQYGLKRTRYKGHGLVYIKGL